MDKQYRGQTAIFAGMFGKPSWAQGLALFEWTLVPGNTIAAIDPEKNPQINPNFPAASPWRGNGGIADLLSYSGGAFDDTTGFFWKPIQGGHQDYGGNDPWRANVFNEYVQWEMVRPPSGAIGNVINLWDGKESTGLYADGRLRAVHSYGYNCAANGKVYAGALIGQFPQGQSGKAWCVEIDTKTGEYRLVCDYTGSNIGSGYAAAAIDPTRNKLYSIGRETARFVEVDLVAGTFVNIGAMDNIFGGYSYVCGVYAEGADRVIFVSGQTSNTAYKARRGLAIINPLTKAVTYPSCEAYPAFLGGAIGAAWSPVRGALLLWDNADETNKVAMLTPSNPTDLSQPWTCSVISGTGVMPTSREPTGTYNRWQYSKRLGGCLLLNATNQQMYFLRTD